MTRRAPGSQRCRQRALRSVRSHTLGRVVLVCCALWLAAASADAQAGALDYEGAIARAIQEFDLGHWDEARALFERAHSLRPNARTLRGLGLVEFERRSYVHAEQLLAASLDDPRMPLTPALRLEVQDVLTRTRTFIGRVMLHVEPKNAEVLIDDAPAERDSAGRIALDLGAHTLLVRRAGFRDDGRRLDLVGGQLVDLTITLVAEPPPVTPLTAAPGDAQSAAAAGEARVDAGAGAHRSAALPVILLIAGGAAIASGTVMGVIALQHSSDGASDRQAASADTWALGADLALGTGVVAAGLGVLLLWRGDGAHGALTEQPPQQPSAQPSTISVAPSIGPHALGLHARGAF